MSLLNEDIVKLFYSALNGGIRGTNEFIYLSDNYSYTVVIDKIKAVNDLETENDFIESFDDKNYIITSTGSTLNSAKNSLFQYLETICDETYYKKIENSEQKEEIRL